MISVLGKSIAAFGAGNIERILLERLKISGIPASDLFICGSYTAAPLKKKSDWLQQKLEEV